MLARTHEDRPSRRTPTMTVTLVLTHTRRHEDTKGTKERIMLRVTTPLMPHHESIVGVAIDSGLTVHKELGPGFREPIYERAFRLELASRGVSFETQKPIVVRYKDWEIPGQRVDLVLEGFLLVEIKAVRKLVRVHRAQVLSYLKTMNLRVGLIMNFSQPTFREGLRRVVL
jgi:GxxExxY protein